MTQDAPAQDRARPGRRRHGLLRATWGVAGLLAWAAALAAPAHADPSSQGLYPVIQTSPGETSTPVIGVVPMCVTGTAASVGPGFAVLCGTYGTTATASGGSSGSGGSTAAAAAVIPVTTTQTTGATSTSPGTFTQALAGAGATVRHGCTLQNTSLGTEYVFFGNTPPSSLSGGLAMAAGTPIDCAHGGLVVAQDTLWIASASASASYVLLAQ